MSAPDFITGWQTCERCGECDAPQGMLPFCSDCLEEFHKETFGLAQWQRASDFDEQVDRALDAADAQREAVA